MSHDCFDSNDIPLAAVMLLYRICVGFSLSLYSDLLGALAAFWPLGAMLSQKVTFRMNLRLLPT